MKFTKLIAAAGCAVALLGTSQAETIVIKGSDTLGAKFIPRLAEAYKAKNPGISFSIAAEGSSTGIAAIIAGTADIGMSSRKVLSKEITEASAKGFDFKAYPVAYDGIAVIVNKSSPLTALTKKQVEQVFTGDVSDWSAVGGKPGAISIYTRNTSSGTYKDFQGMAMNKRDYAPKSQKMAGNEQIVAEVSKNANGIGYVGLAYTKSPGIKVLAIDGKTPDVADVQNRSYVLSRTTYLYTDGKEKPAAKAFIEYALSPEGQKIAEQSGFAPLK